MLPQVWFKPRGPFAGGGGLCVIVESRFVNVLGCVSGRSGCIVCIYINNIRHRFRDPVSRHLEDSKGGALRPLDQRRRARVAPPVGVSQGVDIGARHPVPGHGRARRQGESSQANRAEGRAWPARGGSLNTAPFLRRGVARWRMPSSGLSERDRPMQGLGACPGGEAQGIRSPGSRYRPDRLSRGGRHGWTAGDQIAR